MLFFYNKDKLNVAYLKAEQREGLNRFKSAGPVIGSEVREGRSRTSPPDYLFKLAPDVDAKFDVETYNTGHSYDDWKANYVLYKPEFPRINKIINALQYHYCGHVDLSFYLDDTKVDDFEISQLVSLFESLELVIYEYEQGSNVALLPRINECQFDTIAQANSAVMNKYLVMPIGKDKQFVKRNK